jgi:hypothetical protein
MRIKAIGVALAAFGSAVWVALSASGSGDYSVDSAVSGDNAGPALQALAHGDLGGFARHQPLMGLTSLLVRLPISAVGNALGAGEPTVYRLGALACFLPCALFAAWLILERCSTAAGLLSAALAAYVLLAAPTTASAVNAGHPEELLAAALATAAVLAAIRQQPGWAGVLLGISIATKEWTVIAALPVLTALSARRVRAAVISAASALVLLAPPVLADPAAFARASRSLGATHLVNALSAWWPLSFRPAGLPAGAPLAGILPLQLTKSSALAIVLALALGLSALGWARARDRGPGGDSMALLALLGLVRCLGDPGPVEYYYLALLVPLAVWETMLRQRLPLATAAALAAVSLTFESATRLGANELNLITLGWGLALGAYLAARAFDLKRAPVAPITAACEH